VLGLMLWLLHPVVTTAATLSYSIGTQGSASASGQLDAFRSCLPIPSPGRCGASDQAVVSLSGPFERSLSVAALARASNSFGETVVATAEAEVEFSVFGPSYIAFGNNGGSSQSGVLFASASASAKGDLRLSLSERFSLTIPRSMQGRALDLVIRHSVDGTLVSAPGTLPTGVRFQVVQSSSLNDSDNLLEDFIAASGQTRYVDDVLETSTRIQHPGQLVELVSVKYAISIFSGGQSFSHDFLNTVGLALIVPEGVSLISESGLFESFVASPAAVPEPAPFAMVVLGLALLWRLVSGRTLSISNSGLRGRPRAR
jgi:hypothetical protein